MAIGDSYLSFEEFRARTRSTTTGNDAAIQAVLKSASQSIEGHCGQQFNKSDEDTTKIVTSRCWDLLDVPPLVSVTTVETDGNGDGTYETTWETTDFDLFPYDAADILKPYLQIRRSRAGTLRFPTGVRGVRVTGIWGWPEVPAPVKEVCFLMANRLKSLWDAPFGASGSTNPEMAGLNMTMSITPLLKQMLAPYVVRTV